MNRAAPPFDPTPSTSVVVIRDPGGQQTPVVRSDPKFSRTEELDDFVPSPGRPDVPELGHFEVLETIGRGGFGVVVKAFDRHLHRTVAIKLMTEAVAATSPARKRFVREARAAAAVRHENVVHIYAVEEHPVPHLVMEYVPGGSLQLHLDQFGPLEAREVLRLGAQIARGLAAAHEQGLVHRDVKPANVLLEPGVAPRAKLTDFGIARAADDASLTQSGTVLGTPMYMAPEQAKGERVDHRSDLFSLGSVLYTMIGGHPPFRAANSLAVLKRVSDESPRPLREVAPEAPPWLCDLVGKLHARDPDHRFQSAAAAADIMEALLTDLERSGVIRVRVPGPPAPARPRWGPGLGLAARRGRAARGAVFAASRPTPPAGDPPPAPEPPAATPAGPPAANFTNSLGIEFVRVPAGKSALGGREGTVGPRTVEFARDFHIGKFEVTHEQWDKVMGPGRNPSRHSRTGDLAGAVLDVPDDLLKRFPVDSLTWNECQAFIRELNRQSQDAGWVYRLPTSDEWEYACRNGPGQSARDLGCDFYAGDPSTTLDGRRMNIAPTGLNRPCPVGSYPPNRLGIHDLQGNVFEHLDDLVWEAPEQRPIAGGFWGDDKPDTIRARVRAMGNAGARMFGAGFRIVRVPADAPLTPRQLLDAVTADLVRLNPGYGGRVRATVTDGRITKLVLLDNEPVKDISALRALRHLEVLDARGGQFSDLTPLRGLPLREINFDNNTAIRDLTPLRGLPLEWLAVWGYQGEDLSALAGMRLRFLNCGGGGKRIDLTPLKGMPLGAVVLNHTQIDDLSPLEGAPLEDILIENTHVADLEPLRGMKLRKFLARGSRVTDLGVVRGMPLRELTMDFDADRDTEFVRSFPKLTLINNKSPAEFWKGVEKK